MKPSMTFAELQVGASFTGIVWVRQNELATDRNGSEFLRFTLGDSAQNSLLARYFTFPFADRDALLEAEWACVNGIYSVWNNSANLKITSLVPCDPPADIENYLPCSPIPLTELLDRLHTHIQSVVDPHLSRLLTCIFEDTQITDSFYRWPAAQSRHHAYRHGLLHHTLEVTDVVSSIARVQQKWGTPPLNRDLALTGALLHDIGKIKEMHPDANTFVFTDPGNLLGHVSLGIEKVRYCIHKVNRDLNGKFPPALGIELLHIIAAHHGKGEWGAIVEPKTPEAELVHHADMISTRLYYYAEKTVGDNGGNFASQRKLSESGNVRSVYINRYKTQLESPVESQIAPGEMMEISDLLARMSPLPIVRLLREESGNNYAVSSRRLPILGRSAAGEPLLDSANDDGYQRVDWKQLPDDTREYYLLRIEGESMIGDDIQDGDFVVVRRQDRDEPGEIVVVWLDGGATVKRIRREKGEIWLDSSNPNEMPLHVHNPVMLRIQGCVVAVARY